MWKKGYKAVTEYDEVFLETWNTLKFTAWELPVAILSFFCLCALDVCVKRRGWKMGKKKKTKWNQEKYT